MTSRKEDGAFNALSPWLGVQLDIYGSFLQRYSDTLLERQPQRFEISFSSEPNHIDDYDYDFEDSLLIFDQDHQQQQYQDLSLAPFKMSNQQSSFHSQSYTSSTFSSSSNGEAPKTWRKTESTETNPSGTTVRRSSEQPGQASIQETLRYDHEGKAIEQPKDTGRIEDVTDADREYLERMEDEYAKREGGA
jgi:hypothetical protein